MRKATLAALIGATSLVVGVKFVAADTPLYETQADFGGSQYAPGGSQPIISPYTIFQNPNPVPPGQIKQTNYIGLGLYNSGTTGSNGGTIAPFDSLGDSLTYSSTSLGSLNITTNGLANFDNYNPATGTGKTPDAALGTSYAGLTSPTGSLVVNQYAGGYTTMTSGETIVDLPGTATESPASVAYINALTSGKCLAYDITAPGGGTTASTTYFETTFETFDNNGGFNGSGHMQANPTGSSLASKNKNEYGTGAGLTVGNDDPGSFAVAHGSGASSYWTVYLPYSFSASYASTLTYLQFVLELNSGGDQIGNVTIDNIRTVSPTWAASGSGLSWNTATVVNYSNPDGAPLGTPANGVMTQQGNWVGAGSTGYGTPNGSGISATFGDLESGNASVGLDTTQTLGMLNFNSLNYQYTLTPSSTGSATSGNLVMDNTVNAAPAQINDVAGGNASTNFTEFVAVPVTLNSSTAVTVTRSTDILDITGNISGTGALSMSGAGTLQLYGNNSYSGGTSVASGTVLVSTSGALPANKGVTVSGGVLELASTIAGGNLALSSLSITGGKVVLDTNATAGSKSASPPATSNVNITSLSITGNGTLDINNNHIIINYGTGSDPIASIAAYVKSGYANGAWNGHGIMSTAAQTNGGSYGIGYADAADAGNPAGLASGQIEIMYTLLGDANLDGAVNGSDFAILTTNFNKAVSGWDQGDFNYDGAANGSDFALLASNFNKGASQSAISTDAVVAGSSGGLLTSVPEPASAGLLILGALGALSRRRRNSNG